jgi:hypothetical protein
MNPWRRGPLTVNPYYRTAFAVARVPREVVQRKTVVRLIGQARQVVRADPQAHVLAGGPVSEPELNAAEQVLLDPQRRVLEELLAHAAEAPPLDRVRQLAQQAAAALAPDADRPPVTNLAGLGPLTGWLVRQFLDQAPPADPSFGALETELIPPFGRPEDD